jgi:hypothetical protein
VPFRSSLRVVQQTNGQDQRQRTGTARPFPLWRLRSGLCCRRSIRYSGVASPQARIATQHSTRLLGSAFRSALPDTVTHLLHTGGVSRSPASTIYRCIAVGSDGSRGSLGSPSGAIRDFVVWFSPWVEIAGCGSTTHIPFPRAMAEQRRSIFATHAAASRSRHLESVRRAERMSAWAC